MLGQATLPGLHSATFSRVSASGVMPYAAPDGLMTGPCGQEVAPANLSARQAKERGLLTSGTFGPRSSTSSASAALTQFLANRLRQRTALLGSTLYTLTWRVRVTPSGRSIPALRASARRISANGYTGWLTPSARDWKDTPGMARTRKDGRSRMDQLSRQVFLLEREQPAFGGIRTGSAVWTAHPGLLNPAHARWLMGLPPEWDACAAMATPLSRRKPKRS